LAIQSQKPGAKPGSPKGALQDPRAAEEAARQDRHRNDELADACGRLEEDLEALKARFEMYFLGVDRREPARERVELKRRVEKMKGEFTRNTGLRFRIETLHARFLSYERMWVRSAREKEEGTYRRDLQRARRHADKRRQEEARRAREGAAEPAPAASAKPDAASEPAAPPPPPAAPAGPPAAAPPLPEAQLRAIYDAYVAAKKRCNEDVSKLTFDALARSIAKQVPQLIAQYKAKSVEFKVVVKDGRAVLKAVPRV
jgi:hypothetical protein